MYYDKFGGIFLPESLMAANNALIETFERCQLDPSFQDEIQMLYYDYIGRETPLTEVPQFAKHCHGPTLYLKREDLLHTGAHKINNALGQCLIAKRMGKTHIIAETGAGQHGVATATACAKLGLTCTVYMGAVDVARQMPNVEKMKLLGAEVIAVITGTQTLKDAVNEALRDYAASFETAHYCLGSALGPHPYPAIVEYFQAVIGRETKAQCLAKLGRLPNHIIACVGGGSNAIGMFSDFIEHTDIKLYGIEAGGHGKDLGQHAARIENGRPGILHGCYSYVLQDQYGQIAATHSISAGLDYPMIGPQHAALFEQGRVHYSAVADQTALEAFKLLARTEGIIPALESSHALGFYMQQAHQFAKDDLVVINLSGRGDKDLPALLEGGKL